MQFFRHQINSLKYKSQWLINDHAIYAKSNPLTSIIRDSQGQPDKHSL